jgi:hypothetical protein
MKAKHNFNDILRQVADKNARTLVERATLANALAKVAATSRAARGLYAAKTAALEHGLVKFVDEYTLASFEDDGRLIGISWRHRRSFHVRTAHLGAGSRVWMNDQRRAIVDDCAAYRRAA